MGNDVFFDRYFKEQMKNPVFAKEYKRFGQELDSENEIRVLRALSKILATMSLSERLELVEEILEIVKVLPLDTPTKKAVRSASAKARRR